MTKSELDTLIFKAADALLNGKGERVEAVRDRLLAEIEPEDRAAFVDYAKSQRKNYAKKAKATKKADPEPVEPEAEAKPEVSDKK